MSKAGSGGFATVQVAWDTRIQRRVAIKCIALDDSDMIRSYEALADAAEGDPYENADSFESIPGLDEARTAAMLSDPHIVGVYDFEVQGNMAYLIMEYVDGITLSDLIHDYDADLSLDALAAIFSSIATALKTAHANQVLHLDIKPDNVLINRQGQVKVTDFGLATLSDAMGFGYANGGTIGYMPLEQMRQESLDARCDEWALASLTYEMISGSNPFLARDLKKAEKVIEEAELVLPSLCRSDLNPEIDDVLFYALDPDREERYGSVSDFSEEMNRFLGNAARGHKELATIIGQAEEEFEEEAEEEPIRERIPLSERLTDRSVFVLGRMWAAINVGVLSFVSLANMPFLDAGFNVLFLGVLALILLAGILKPHLGALLGLLAFCVMLFSQECYLTAILFIVATGAWWFFVGRKGDAQANLALLPLSVGAFGFNIITPLLIGYCLNLKESAITVGYTFFVSLILAGFGSNTLMGWDLIQFWNIANLNVEANMLGMLQQASTWIMLAAWMLGALIISLFCRRGTRLLAGIGIVIATILLAIAAIGGAWIEPATQSLTTTHASLLPHALGDVIFAVVAGLVVFGSCIAFGVPQRYVNDDD